MYPINHHTNDANHQTAIRGIYIRKVFASYEHSRSHTSNDVFVTAEKRLITCLTFDGLKGVQGSNGISVKNTGVKIVSGPLCLHGKCAEFQDRSVLEIPYFVNNYDHFKQFSISFFYRLVGGPIYQVYISYGSIT